MSLKTKVKNDLWRWNYIIPFTKKHQFDEKGRIDFAKYIIRAYRDIHPIRTKEGTVGADTKKLFRKMDIEIEDDSAFVYSLDVHKTIATPGNIISNFTLDYDRIIHGTFDELCASAISPKDAYGKETRYIYEGINDLRQRTYRLLETKKNEKKKIWFQRLLNTPAEHFDEGLQRILFFNQILWQTRHRLNGLGRLDMILADLYEKDIEAGYCTRDGAVELIDDFLRQLSKYASYKSDALEGDIGQIIILGGKNPDGTYFCNELTKLFLNAQAKSQKPDPKTLLRCSENMPKELMELAVACLESKTGSPLFSNDDVVIPALLDFGISEEDAYSYCTSACWEPFIVGKSFDQNNMAVFDYMKPFAKALLKDKEYIFFDELIEAYICEAEKAFEDFLKATDELKWAKDPLVSLFTYPCTEKRKDVSDGGAVYNNYGITTVGMANVVDSLLNLKKLVFIDRKYTLSDMRKACKQNFRYHECLYNKLVDSKHYGHDKEEVEQLVNQITKAISKIAKKFTNRLGGTVKFGLSSPAYNMIGKRMGADFSGRKAGMPYSTHISCLDAAYTEIVNFAGKLNYNDQRFNGNVVDFFVSPDFMRNNLDKFTIFMMAALRAGFFQMQMNVMNSETLIDAKAKPEKYAGLIVRVWGFSAYFNDLPESYKDLLIERAQMAERIA